MKRLFLDDEFIESRECLERCFCKPDMHPHPVIRSDRPWERDAAFVDSGLVVFDEKEDIFKCWYQGGACYGPGDGSNMCFAVSKDGVNWDKPDLGVVEFDGSKRNNLVLVAECMMHDPAPIIDSNDPDPNRRYKAIWWGGRKDSSQESGWLCGHCVGFSPDGIRWTEHPENPIWPADAEVAVPFGIDRAHGKHVMYCSADGHGLRVVARTESEDFVNWNLPPTVIFKPDDLDPPGTEMAGLSAIDYDGTHVGMLWVIRNLGGITKDEWKQVIDRNVKQGFFGPPITMNATRCRVMHTELATSADGVHWKRLNRAAFLPTGGEGSWDETISLAGRPIVARDKIWIYYTGMGRAKPTPNKATPELIRPWNVDTGLATLRLDGFASLDANSSGGVLVTRSFKVKGASVQLNIQAPNGMAVVEVLEPSGKPIPGFASQDACAITQDHLRAPVLWKDRPGIQSLVGRDVKLRISLKNARLYSISVR